MAEKTAKRRWKQSEIDRILLIGAQMANLCFNLSQSDKIEPRYRQTMKELQTQWDEARRAQ